ncbi:unnamed protein product, partial [Ixodes hexagonus]
MANALLAALDLVAKRDFGRDEEDSTMQLNCRYIERLLLDDDAEQRQAPWRWSSPADDRGVQASGNHVMGVQQLVAEGVRKSLLNSQCHDASQSCSSEEPGLGLETPSSVSRNEIFVEYGGRFPCLRVRVRGLQPRRKYFVALDLPVVRDKRSLEHLACAEPYCVPTPNHLEGWQWMESELSFNLNAAFTEHLRKRCGFVKGNEEYEPTLRVLELQDDLWPSVEFSVNLGLNEATFRAFLLGGVEGGESPCVTEQKYLLVKKSLLVGPVFFYRNKLQLTNSGILASESSLADCSVVVVQVKRPRKSFPFLELLRQTEEFHGRRVGGPSPPSSVPSTFQRLERPSTFQPLES